MIRLYRFFPLICFITLTACQTISPAPTEQKLEVETLVKTSQSWDGSELPHYPNREPEVTILRIKIPPGMRLPAHRHPVINAGVLLEGELTVTKDDGSELHLKKGDSIVELVNHWHYGMNPGNTTAEIIVFYAGTKNTPITVKQ